MLLLKRNDQVFVTQGAVTAGGQPRKRHTQATQGAACSPCLLLAPAKALVPLSVLPGGDRHRGADPAGKHPPSKQRRWACRCSLPPPRRPLCQASRSVPSRSQFKQQPSSEPTEIMPRVPEPTDARGREQNLPLEATVSRPRTSRPRAPAARSAQGR